MRTGDTSRATERTASLEAMSRAVQCRTARRDGLSWHAMRRHELPCRSRTLPCCMAVVCRWEGDTAGGGEIVRQGTWSVPDVRHPSRMGGAETGRHAVNVSSPALVR